MPPNFHSFSGVHTVALLGASNIYGYKKKSFIHLRAESRSVHSLQYLAIALAPCI